MTHGCIWFNHCYEPERGYGYVAASRFRTKSGIYLYGAIRATDWLPVGGKEPYEDTKRSDLSDDSDYDDTEEAALVKSYADRDYDNVDSSGSDEEFEDERTEEEKQLDYDISEQRAKELFGRLTCSIKAMEIERGWP